MSKTVKAFNAEDEKKYYAADTLTPLTPEALASLEADMRLWVPEANALFNHATVLDLGAGKAPVGTLIAQRYPAALVVSLELVFHRLRVARVWQQQSHMLSLACGDVFRLPLADGVFDCVIANSFLHHLPNMSQAVAEIVRVLKPGGRYIGREPNFNNPLVRWGVFAFPGTPLLRGNHSPNEYPLRAQEISTAFKQHDCACTLHYFWRRLPWLRHPLLSVAMSVQARRLP